MFGRGADLLFDDIEIVEQPFPSRSHAPLFLDVFRQQAVYVPQHPLVFGQARQKTIVRACVCDLVHSGKDLAMLLHLRDAEKLRPEGEFLGNAFFGWVLPG